MNETIAFSAAASRPLDIAAFAAAAPKKVHQDRAREIGRRRQVGR